MDAIQLLKIATFVSSAVVLGGCSQAATDQAAGAPAAANSNGANTETPSSNDLPTEFEQDSLTVEQGLRLRNNSQWAEQVLWVDVRTNGEWQAGHLEGAVHLPINRISQAAANLNLPKDKLLVTYCAAGIRAQRATKQLQTMGYRVTAINPGGYQQLKNSM